MGQILLWVGFFEMAAGVPAMQQMLDGSGRCVWSVMYCQRAPCRHIAFAMKYCKGTPPFSKHRFENLMLQTLPAKIVRMYVSPSASCAVTILAKIIQMCLGVMHPVLSTYSLRLWTCV